MECSTYLLLPVAASSAHTWPWFTSVSLTFTEYSRLFLATKDNVSLLVKMEFCRQPIYRIKGCQYFWVRHKGLLIVLGKRWKRMFPISLWRNPRPWRDAPALICPPVWWLFDGFLLFFFFTQRHKLDFFSGELYSGGASRHGPGEKQNSLWRRVIFNKPAEVRGDRSTAQSQYNNWLQREECGGPLQPSRKTGVRGDWSQLRPLQQVIQPREHDPISI